MYAMIVSIGLTVWLAWINTHNFNMSAGYTMLYIATMANIQNIVEQNKKEKV